MNNELINIIKIIKNKYINDGFQIIGIFGSYARNEETNKSDIDILYEISDVFINKNGGFGSCYKLETIKDEMKHSLGKNVDIIDIKSLKEKNRTEVLKEVYYV